MTGDLPQAEAVFRCAANTEDTMEVNTFTRFGGERMLSFELQVARHPEDDPNDGCVLLSRPDAHRLHELLGRVLNIDNNQGD
jgi:hypothetical protein